PTASVKEKREDCAPTMTRALRGPPGDDRRIMSAETEAVAHHNVELALTRCVRRVVEVAGWIGRRVIDGGRTNVVGQRPHANHEFDAATGAKQMPELALGAGDAELASVIVEDVFDGDGFGLIAQRRAGAVGVDVVDGRRVELAVPERAAHRARGA